MRAPLQITFEGAAHPGAIEAAAHEKLRQLERAAGPVLACKVVIAAQDHKHHRGRPLVARLEVSVPGRDLIVDGVEHRDVYVALQRAFDDMKRQLLSTLRCKPDKGTRLFPVLPADVSRPDGPAGAARHR